MTRRTVDRSHLRALWATLRPETRRLAELLRELEEADEAGDTITAHRLRLRIEDETPTKGAAR